ncbi:MAG: hypothetical protein KKH67_00295 [candidate division Zixibacteria bacterium]|nr:hypothetical protein [candidate division Zixibacteria bacterium]MBU1471789.1 hypothetical protein [candidate division Zixibacteria bacterium]
MAILNANSDEESVMQGSYEVTVAGVNFSRDYYSNGKTWDKSLADGFTNNEQAETYSDNSNDLAPYVIVNHNDNNPCELVHLSRFDDESYLKEIVSSGSTLSGTVMVTSTQPSHVEMDQTRGLLYRAMDSLRAKSPLIVRKCVVVAVLWTVSPTSGPHKDTIENTEVIYAATVEHFHGAHNHQEFEPPELSRLVREATASGVRTINLSDLLDIINKINT